MTSYLLLTFFWVLFYILHSLLITNRMKNYMQRILKDYFKYYRLSYNIFSTITFLIIIWYAATIPVFFVFDKNPISNYMGLFLAVLGVIIGKKGFKAYNTGEFLGISQIRNNQDQPEEYNDLKTDGLQGKVRHPLYSATICLFIGFWFFSPTIANSITVIAALLYLIIGIRLEEKKLIKHFGRAYLDYKNKVPMLIPKFW
ncbi:MAG: methyltransferase family protein [Cyclobacteriaceae bacterium]